MTALRPQRSRPSHLGRLAGLSLLALAGLLLVAACSALGGTPTPPPPTPTSTPQPTPTSIIPTSLPDLAPADPPPAYTVRVVNAYPHDPAAFTQGLVIVDGELYEGTGLRGRSSLRQVDLQTGTVLKSRALAPEYFGEGVTVLGDRIYQLTWQSHLGLIYDRATFEPKGTFQYPTEGWGLTHDGQRLIMSDGTATLRFLDPETLVETGQVEVTDRGEPVVMLNELEYIHGEVWANVWLTDRIARIDPQSGRVVGWLDLSGLLSPEDLTQPADVLNGIAYDADRDRLYVTGKLWPKLFEIELIPQQP